jgi:hypothetical protein
LSHPPGPEAPYHQPPVPPPPTSGKATLSAALGFTGLFLCGFLTGIPAIVLGFSARREIREANAHLDVASGHRPAMGGQNLALGGIIAGAVGTLWMLVGIGILVALVLFGVEAVDDYNDACDQVRSGQPGDDTFFGETIGPEDCP